MKALGVDVGVRKGHDLVLLTDGMRIVQTTAHVTPSTLASLVSVCKPDVVAIDSPPAFPSKGPRETEISLRRRGMTLFSTPWDRDKQKRTFYDWMKEGFVAHQMAIDEGYPLFKGGKRVNESTIEVFPFATAVVLSGACRPHGASKLAWRRDVLKTCGVDADALEGIDQVDAALAACTGLLALHGRFCWEGTPSEGVIVLPCAREDLLPRYK